MILFILKRTLKHLHIQYWTVQKKKDCFFKFTVNMNSYVLKLVTVGSTHSECHYVLQQYIHQYRNVFVSFHTNVLLVHFVSVPQFEIIRHKWCTISQSSMQYIQTLTLCNKHCLEAKEIWTSTRWAKWSTMSKQIRIARCGMSGRTRTNSCSQGKEAGF